ncbi:MAG: hypothetical protein AAFR59_20330, partial [Bacteroidota bacterium]
RTNEIIGFLQAHSPDELAALQNEFSDFRHLLSVGVEMGEAKDVVNRLDIDKLQTRNIPTPGPQARKVLMYAKLTEKALAEALVKAGELMQKLRVRIKRARNVQLISQIIVALGGASLFTDIGKQTDWVKYAAGGTALIGSILTLVVQRLEVGTFSGGSSMASIYDDLVELRVQAQQQKRELEVALDFVEETEQWKELEKILHATNDITGDIQTIWDQSR